MWSLRLKPSMRRFFTCAPVATGTSTFVLLVHLVLVLWLTCLHSPFPSKPKALKVRTMGGMKSPSTTLPTSAPLAIKSSPSAPSLKALPQAATPSKKTKSSPAKAPSSSAKLQVKKSTSKKSPSSPQPPSPTLTLLKELEESIGKIEGKRDNLIPRPLVQPSSKQVDPGISVALPREMASGEELAQGWGLIGEGSYQASLVAYLKETLHLPEYGEVKAQVTVNSEGQIIHMHILKAESIKNREYLEKHLPKLYLPKPSSLEEKGREKNKTFCLVFCNQIGN